MMITVMILLLRKTRYEYNVFGEIIEKTAEDMEYGVEETVTMEYDVVNRLKTWNGQEVTYDAKGMVRFWQMLLRPLGLNHLEPVI